MPINLLAERQNEGVDLLASIPQERPKEKLSAETAWNAANDGVKINTQMLLQKKWRDGNATPQDMEWIAQMKEEQQGRGKRGWVNASIETGAQMATMVGQSAREAGYGAMAGAAVGGATGGAVGAVTGAGATFTAGFPIFMAKNIYNMSVGEAFGELKEYNDANNLGLDDGQLGTASDIIGFGMMALDIWSMKNVGKMFAPAGNQVAKKFVIAQTAKAMKDPSVVKALMSGGKDAFIAWLGETVTEGLQKGLVEIGKEGARIYTEADFTEIAAGIGSAMATGAGGGTTSADIPAELSVDFPTAERMGEIWDTVHEEMVMAGKGMVGVSLLGGGVGTSVSARQAIQDKKKIKDAEQRWVDNGATQEQVAEIRKSVPPQAIAQQEERQQRIEQETFKRAMNKIDTMEDLTTEEQQSIEKHFGEDARAVAQGQRMELVREERDAIVELKKNKDQTVAIKEEIKARQTNIERISGIARAVQQAKGKTETLGKRADYYDSLANELEVFEEGDSKEANILRKQAEFAREDAVTVQKELRKQKKILLPKDSQQAKDVENMKKTLRSRKMPKKIRKALQAGYVNTTANVWSAMNSMFGPKVADEFNFEMEESSRNDAVDAVVERAQEAGRKILGVKNFEATAIEMNNDTTKLTGPQGTVEVSTWDIMDLWTLYKNDNSKMLLNEAYGQETLDGLFSRLTDQQKEFADYLQQEVQPYFDVFNEWSIESKGVEIPSVKSYWPRKSIKVDGVNTNDVFDHIKTVGEQPGPTKHRASSGVTPLPQNMWSTFQRHVAEGEHVRHVSPKYERVKSALSEQTMKSIIENKFGKRVYQTTQGLVDQMALNKVSEHIDMVSETYGKLVNNWAVSKIALSPTTFARQLGSVTNYAEVMPAGEWATGFFDAVTSPKETFDFMWNNSEYIRRRFGRGYSEALADALEDAKKFGDKKIKLMKFLTSFGRTGDVGAIIYGGAPYVKNQIAEYKQKNPNATEQEATDYGFEQLKKQTIRSQQSGLKSSLSVLQNSKNPFMRAMLRFKNTPNQYVRKMVDAQIALINGDITKKQYTKTMAVYALIQPFLYVTLGEVITAPLRALGGDDPEDLVTTYAERVITKVVTSPTAGIPVLGSMIENAVMALIAQDKRYAFRPVQLPVLDGILHAAQMLTKDEITALDYMKIIAEIQEPLLPIPTGLAARYIDYATED
jgi:hypothetical protein